MTTVSTEFESILEKYNRAKLNTYNVLELLGSDYTFNDYGSDVQNKHYEELLNCGTVLVFHKEQTTDKSIYHLTHSNFCRKRICPMCQFRKSEKTFAEMLKAKSSFVRARGFLLICNQARGAADGQIEAVFGRMVPLLHDPKPTVVRQCLGALHEVVLYRPEMSECIRKSLAEIDPNQYKDSMAPLIRKDMDALIAAIL